jgi:hypothetical protein
LAIGVKAVWFFALGVGVLLAVNLNILPRAWLGSPVDAVWPGFSIGAFLEQLDNGWFEP